MKTAVVALFLTTLASSALAGAHIDGYLYLYQGASDIYTDSQAQYYDALGFTPNIQMQGLHTLQNSTDNYWECYDQWVSFVGWYQGSEENSWQYNHTYVGRNSATTPDGATNEWADTRVIDACETCPQDCSATNSCSPIVLTVDGGYEFTGLEDPVRFDLDADGSVETVGWVSRSGSVALLALDRDGNGRIDNGGELFGNFTRSLDGTVAKNGFEALAALDTDGNGRIDASDEQWDQLMLWFDTNHDGRSQPDELAPLASAGIQWLSLKYHGSGRRDVHGNLLRFESRFGSDRGERPYYDVFLVSAAARPATP